MSIKQATTATNEFIQKLFVVLSEREQSVIIRRFGLANQQQETLESIGNDLTITRERVRQIESFAIKKLKRMGNNTDFSSLYELISKITETNGGIISEKALVNEVLGKIGNNNNLDGATIRLALEIHADLTKIKRTKRNDKAWHLNTINKQTINTVIKSALSDLKEANKIISEKTLLKKLQLENSNINQQTIKAILEVDNRLKLVKEGYGLTKWRHVEPKSIRDKALIILRRTNKPMHFVEIANKISEAEFAKKQVTTQAVHNELIRYNEFVLVGRGLYALKEWGYKQGTVRDVLTDILKDGQARKKQEIVDAVLERRHVKIGTISLNLQKYPEFERVARATYQYNKTLKS